MIRSGLRNPRFRDAAWVLAAWLIGALVFFRSTWRSGFGKLIGNTGDSRLLVYLSEHWFRVFHGQDSWLNPQFFYPTRGLLGWSDTLLDFQIFYTPLRLLGCSPFLAIQLTIILLSLVGFASFVWLVRICFGTPLVVAIGAGLAFAFSNTLWVHSGAYQDYGVYFLPLELLVGVYAWRAAAGGRPRRAMVLGAVTGLLAAVIFYSTYYTAYFGLLSIITFGVIYLLIGRGGAIRQWRASLHTLSWALPVTAASFAVGLVPFLVTYLPVRKAAAGPSYAVVMSYAARPQDYVDFSGGNLFWSSLIHHIIGRINYAPSSYEHTYSPTPILMVAAILGGAACLWWRARPDDRSRPDDRRDTAAKAGGALAASAIIVALLPLRTTRFGSPWALIYHVPGANAMRAIDRIQIVVGLMACLALAAAAGAVQRRTTGNDIRYRAALVLVAALVVGEQITTHPDTVVDNAAQMRLITSVRPAPGSCRSFYVIDSADPNRFFYEYQLDAMLISQRLHLPTINGYTGYDPKGWNLEDPAEPSYLASVKEWSDQHGLSAGLCQLDLGTLTWRVGPVPSSASSS